MRPDLIFLLVQLLFTLTWTIYVAFLPQLADAAGIERVWVVRILVADQLMFIVMDLLLGVASDRVAAALRRLGPWMIAINAASCAAFIALPYAAGSFGATGLIVATVAWSLTSSALRAPLMAMIGKCARPERSTRLTAFALLGLGVAGALAPSLTAALRGVDPRLPFALAGVGLLVAASTLSFAETALRQDAGAPVAEPPRGGLDALFFTAALLACAGFQVHTALNSAAAYLRLASPAQLEWLMPAFWVGFSLAIVPVGQWIERRGAPAVLVAGMAAGGICLALIAPRPALPALVILQAGCGAAWALVIAALIGAALASGRSGREGRASGRVFALIALAAMLRLIVVAAGWNKLPGAAELLEWAPLVLWAAATVLGVWWLYGGGRRLVRTGTSAATPEPAA